MRVITRSGLNWTLIGAAYLAIGGCGGSIKSHAELPPAVPEIQANTTAPEPPRATPGVDVLGEFDGTERNAPSAFGQMGFQQHTFNTEGADGDVAVDPTGKWIAFSSTRHSEHSAIYLQRSNGVSVTQLTGDDCDAANPTFSPDGKQVAFSSNRGGNWNIYMMEVDGRNVTQVTNGLSQDMHPSFSPDGTRVVFSSLAKSNQWELWTITLATSERRMIGYGLFPSWAPDKAMDRIAFQRPRQRGSHFFSVWTLDLIDGEARRLTEITASGNAAIVSPAWSPDGKKLAFTTIVEPKRTASGKTMGQQDVWIVNVDGTGRRRLTDGNGSNLTPYWAVDNRVYFVSDRGGNPAVWSVQAGPAPMAAAASARGVENKVDVKKAVGATEEKEVAP